MSKTPKLRFKEFSGDWEVKKLGDECRFFSGGTPLTTNRSYYDGNIPFIRSAEISGDTTELTISESGLNNSSAKMVQKGDLLYALYGATSGEVSISKIDGAINQAILCIKSDTLNLSFLEKILRKNKQNIINTYLQGGQGNLSSNIVKGLKYSIPSIEEQEKIASFFSLIDDKISLQGEKVEALRDYKKGMMQKIFSRELRFKDDEGRDYPEWEEKRLESIVSKKKKGKNAIYAESGNILLNNEYMENNTEPMYVENEIDVNEKDILILWDGSQAGKMYTGFTGVLGSTFVAITLDKHNCNRFIHQQLMYNLDKIQLAWREGSGVPHVAKDFIENFKIKVPKLEEQRKISKLLEGIDSKLKKEQEKLDSLNEYKKGLLQQMFV